MPRRTIIGSLRGDTYGYQLAALQRPRFKHRTHSLAKSMRRAFTPVRVLSESPALPSVAPEPPNAMTGQSQTRIRRQLETDLLQSFHQWALRTFDAEGLRFQCAANAALPEALRLRPFACWLPPAGTMGLRSQAAILKNHLRTKNVRVMLYSCFNTCLA